MVFCLFAHAHFRLNISEQCWGMRITWFFNYLACEPRQITRWDARKWARYLSIIIYSLQKYICRNVQRELSATVGTPAALWTQATAGTTVAAGAQAIAGTQATEGTSS
jgi:hypothetical protein